MTAPRFADSKEAKVSGWFSRRHQTAEAHRAAQQYYRERKKLHGKPKCIRCDERGLVSEATEDYHGEPICPGCHDSIGEAQDERAAEEQY